LGCASSLGDSSTSTLGLLFPHFATHPHARHEELAGELYAPAGSHRTARSAKAIAERAAVIEHFYSAPIMAARGAAALDAHRDLRGRSGGGRASMR